MEKFELVIDGVVYQGRKDDSGDIVLFVDGNDGTHMKAASAVVLGMALVGLGQDGDDE